MFQALKGETVLKKKSLSELKNSKPFYAFDIVLYLAVAAFTVLSFVFVLANGNKGDSQGFFVLYENVVVAEYYYSDGNLIVKDEYAAHFKTDGEKVRFYPDKNDLNDYNDIVIDKTNKTVSIADATCAGKDCTTQKVSASGGFIYCAPHALKIVPTGLTDPVSG